MRNGAGHAGLARILPATFTLRSTSRATFFLPSPPASCGRGEEERNSGVASSQSPGYLINRASMSAI